MEEYLVTIKCKKSTNLKTLEKIGCKILRAQIRSHEDGHYVPDRIDKDNLERMKEHYDIEIHGKMEDIGRKQQAMVGKGNRYQNKLDSSKTK